MPITRLDTAAALIVIDLQKGIIAVPTVHPVSDIVGRAAQLTRAFHARRLPVVLVNVTGTAPGRTDARNPTFSPPPNWTELVPELERQSDDYIVSKQRWGAFSGTSLDHDLRQRGVTQVVVVGIATSIGVESTARSAYECGYNVVLVEDAITDRDIGSHRHSFEKIFPRLGEIDTTDNVLRLLGDTHSDR